MVWTPKSEKFLKTHYLFRQYMNVTDDQTRQTDRKTLLDGTECTYALHRAEKNCKNQQQNNSRNA